MATTVSTVWQGGAVDAWIYPSGPAEAEGNLPLPAGREFVVGAAPNGTSTVVCPDLTEDREIQRVYSGAVEYVTRRGAVRVGLVLEGLTERQARMAYLAARAGAYRFTRYRSGERPEPSLEVRIEPERRTALLESTVVADAQDKVRDWVNIGPSEKAPERMAEMFQSNAPASLGYELLDSDRLREIGAGGMVAVGSASTANGRGPVVLISRHAGAASDAPWLALVGKGITFDSGGLSIKPADGMFRMKGDMAGAAAVMGAMQAIAQLGVQANVIGLAAIAENLVGGAGYRPGDVLRMLDGTTVEVISTDAEGRLVLADGVTLARREGAAAVVDIATLTGANIVALGGVRAGLVSNDDALTQVVQTAAAAAGEPVWPLPTDAPYGELLKSPVADIKNSAGRPAGVITGGLFVGHFAKGVPWVHLDIAGMAFDAGSGRGNGFGVSLLVAAARAWAEQQR